MECSRPLITSDLFRALLRLQRAYVLCETRLRHSLGLNDTDLRAVNLLRSMQTPSSGELARELGVSSAGITSVLDRLEARRLIERRHHATDRRRTLVAPGPAFPAATGPGQVLLRTVHKYYAQLDEPARCALGELLEESLRALDRLHAGPGEPTETTPTKSLE